MEIYVSFHEWPDVPASPRWVLVNPPKWTLPVLDSWIRERILLPYFCGCLPSCKLKMCFFLGGMLVQVTDVNLSFCLIFQIQSNSALQAPAFYGQFVMTACCPELRHFHSNTFCDTLLMWKLSMVSVLTEFDCNKF